MLPTSDLLNRLSESATLKMTALAAKLKASGVNVISLSVGQPDFETPRHIKDAAIEAVNGRFDGYSPVPGYMDLRQAICTKLKRDNNLDYKPEQIIVSTGAKQSLANIFLCFLNKGDEVLIPSPCWVSYPEQVKMCGATPVFVKGEAKNNFKITGAQLEAAITPRTKFIVYSSPCNPTGSVYSKEELEVLAAVLEKYPEIIIVSDEIYEHINYIGKHFSIAQIPSMKDRTIVVNGQAKGYAMPGWRIGYIAAPEYIVKACIKLQGQVTSGASSIAQRATIEALVGNQETTYQMRLAFQKRRDMVLKLLAEIPHVTCVVPDGAFYVFPDVSAYFGKSYEGDTIQDSDDLSMYLLNVGHVATVAGSSFEEPNCIRLSYAASEEELREALSRIKNALAQLK